MVINIDSEFSPLRGRGLQELFARQVLRQDVARHHVKENHLPQLLCVVVQVIKGRAGHPLHGRVTGSKYGEAA